MKEMVERRTNGKRSPREKELAVIETTKSFIVIDNEAVHAVYKTIEDTHEVQLHTLNNGMLSILPIGISQLPLSYIKQHAKYREVELTEFIRTFGSRIESNYRILLNSIKAAGLKPNNYQRKVATNA